MIFYCSNCWNEINIDVEICPHCSASQSILQQESFEKKLIRSLKHPEPKTVIRAVKILGELKSKEALPYLFGILKVQNDPFIIAEAVKSILKIDSTENSIEAIKKHLKLDLGILNPLNNHLS